jgi:hypothetical protein
MCCSVGDWDVCKASCTESPGALDDVEEGSVDIDIRSSRPSKTRQTHRGISAHMLPRLRSGHGPMATLTHACSSARSDPTRTAAARTGLLCRVSNSEACLFLQAIQAVGRRRRRASRARRRRASRPPASGHAGHGSPRGGRRSQLLALVRCDLVLRPHAARPVRGRTVRTGSRRGCVATPQDRHGAAYHPGRGP